MLLALFRCCLLPTISMLRYRFTCLLLLALLTGTLPLMAADPAPERILLDENHPPFSYRDADGKPQGLSLELSRLLIKQLQWPTSVELISWARAESRLRASEPVLIGATLRTTERERQDYLQWSLRLFSQHNYLYRLRERQSELPVSSLRDLNRYRIGTVARSGSYQQLLQAGVQPGNIDTVSHGLQNVDKLLRRRVDFITMQPAMLHHFARHHHADIARFDVALTLADISEFYLCAPRVAPESWTADLQRSWQQLEQQGQFTAIRQRYGLSK